MDLENIFEQVTAAALTYGPKLIGAIVVWIIGGIIIKGLVKGFEKLLNARKLDESLKPFLKGIVAALLKVMLVISVLTMLGIEMTSFVAILGAAGLAVGMALSGTLQNFAGGVMLLIFKPFKNGDVIDAQGHVGVVSEIQIFNTILKTPDNKTIIIPNGGLSNGSMTNYSTEETRRVDWTFGIAYGDDTAKAKEVMMNLMKENSKILQTAGNEPFVAVSELGDSSVNFAVRAWVKAPDYWAVYFDMNEKIYNTFSKEGLNIPYPTMDVNVIK
jgi:small conductance mechanosensitive channel